MKPIFFSMVTLLGFLPFAAASADSDYVLTIKNHRFEPQTLEIPADKRIKLVVKNSDTVPEEFESHELHLEKIILAGQQAVMFIGPLEPGRYGFFGEFHPETAQGHIIVK